MSVVIVKHNINEEQGRNLAQEYLKEQEKQAKLKELAAKKIKQIKPVGPNQKTTKVVKEVEQPVALQKKVPIKPFSKEIQSKSIKPIGSIMTTTAIERPIIEPSFFIDSSDEQDLPEAFKKHCLNCKKDILEIIDILKILSKKMELPEVEKNMCINMLRYYQSLILALKSK